MRKLLCLALMTALLSLSTHAMKLDTRPDFAYPQTVIEQGRQALASATSQPLELRALMDIAVATTRIADDTQMLQLPGLLDEYASRPSSSPAMRSMSLLLLAQVYSHLSYTVPQREAASQGDDWRTWSRAQFDQKILGLLQQALVPRDQLLATPIGDWAVDIDMEGAPANLYPTLYDFVAQSAIRILTERGFAASLPESALAPAAFFTTLTFSTLSPSLNEAMAIYASLLAAHPDDTAAYVNADLQRLALAQSLMPDSEKAYADALGALYSKYAHSPLCVPVLIAWDNECGNTDPAIFPQLRRAVADFPNAQQINCVANAIALRTQPEIMVSLPQCAAPGTDVVMAVTGRNFTHADVEIYDVSDTDLWKNQCRIDPKSRPVATVSVDVDHDGGAPFDVEQKATLRFPRIGNYVAVPRLAGEKPNKTNYYAKIHVTRLAIASSSLEETGVWVVDPEDGSPVKNAEIASNQSKKPLGFTDAEGALRLDLKQSAMVAPRKDGDKFALPAYVYPDTDTRKNGKTYATGYASLPLYRPGDKMEFAAVVYRTCPGQSSQLLPNLPVKATLMDANYQAVDTLALETDAWGRATGKMKIPDNGLTGGFAVKFDCEDGTPIIGNVNFTVSDYKLPTFQITTAEAEQHGAVTLRGQVKTYAGFPLAQTPVDLTLAVRRAWWRWGRYSQPVELFTAEAVTDGQGNFEFTVPAQVMAMSPYPKGLYWAKFTATSPSGENQQAETSFVTSTRYAIECAIPANVNASEAAPINARLKDYRDTDVDLPISYRLITPDSVVVAQGAMPLDPGKVKSGTYQLKLSATHADDYTQTVTIYRPSDKKSPDPAQLLWTAADKMDVSPRRDRNNWLYATNCHAHLLVTLWGDGKLLERQWVDAPAGMHTLNLSLPGGVSRGKATIMAVGGYKSKVCQVSLTSTEAPAKELKITTEVFRDRVTPGQNETWSFRIHAGDSSRQAAVMLDLYNAAIEAVETANTQLFFQQHPEPSFRLREPSLAGKVSQRDQADVELSECPSWALPAFQTYGYGFAPPYTRTLGAMRPLMKQASANQALMAEADGGAVTEDAATYDTAEATRQAGDELKPINYRPAETPLWAFNPTLQTQPDGTLTLTLTVPDENTTWRLVFNAFDRRLRQGMFTAHIVADKPVMVRPNLPRFMRVGDSAVIPALVMNNDSVARTVAITVEIFDPATSEILETVQSTDQIQPGQSATVAATVKAGNASLVGYRVRATSGDFTDGEQTCIPVQPSVTPVIDSQTFYIAPGVDDYTLNVEPAQAQEGTATLHYCNNPTWTVVTALPGLLDFKPSTSNGAAHSLLAACVASGTVKQHPQVVTALRDWVRGDRSDSTLVSMLQRNAELKIALLQATPWMVNAASDSERMTRLAMLLDRSEIDKAKDAAIETLVSLQNKDGGIKWMAGCQNSSVWATTNVLMTFANLTRLGLVRSCPTFVTRAVAWLDAQMVEEQKLHANLDLSAYCYLRPLFPDVPWTSAAKAVYATGVQRTLKNWKRHDVGLAAIDAQILYRANYKTVAREILKSLRQRATTSPQRGMSWPSVRSSWLYSLGDLGTTAVILDAFQLVEPSCADIEKIRQWLILEKQARDWGDSAAASQVVASILCSGKANFDAAPAKIAVDGASLEADNVQAYTGAVNQRIAIDAKQVSITRPVRADYPSYGAVIRQYTANGADVRAAECEELGLERRYDTDGNKTTVVLTVRADRDLDYVALIDKRPACLEPANQLPGIIRAEGVAFYRENRDSETRLFIQHLPRGIYVITYDCWDNNDGTFTAPPAAVQSQYAPQFAAHSSGRQIERE